MQWWRTVLLLFPKMSIKTEPHLKDLQTVQSLVEVELRLLDLRACVVDLWLSNVMVSELVQE